MTLMSDLQDRAIPLKPAMVAFLEEMAKTHNLEDSSKAVRCLINFARENPDKQAEIFAEMRCLDC
jgi:hypothetical protein